MVITSLNTGGAESYLLATLNRLVVEPAEVRVLCCQSSGELAVKIEALGVTVEMAALNTAKLWTTLATLSRSIQFKPHLIHSWMYHGIFFSLPVKLFWPKADWLWSIRNPSVDSPHLPWTTKRLTRLLTSFSQLSSQIVYNSKQAQAEHERVGFPAQKSKLIHNGFHPIASDQETRSGVRERLGFKSDHKLVLFASRYHPQKDPLTFCKTLREAKKNYPNLKCIATGLGLDKDNSNWIANLHQHQLEDTVISKGVTSELQSLMQACDALILTSKEDSFPNVIGEALSAGLPVVSTNVGDLRVLCGSLAKLSPPGDWLALSRVLIRVLSMNAVERQRFQYKAKRWIDHNFSFERQFQKLTALYPWPRSRTGQL